MTKPNLIQMAAKFYDARDSMKRVLGDKWPERRRTATDTIAAYMDDHNCDALCATIRLMREVGDSAAPARSIGFTQMLLMAACADMVEPTESKP